MRLEDPLWQALGEAAADQDTNRTEVVRRFARWYTRQPGAKLPKRPQESFLEEDISQEEKS